MRPVYFLSDFGLEDPYAGIVQAVLEARAPGVRVVHLAHGLPPGDLRRAAYALFEALPYLPPGSVLLAVVDPGVGTGRRAVAAWGERLYVGPDNGLFTLGLAPGPTPKGLSPENPLSTQARGGLPPPRLATRGAHLPRPGPLRPRRRPPGPGASPGRPGTRGSGRGPGAPAPKAQPRAHGGGPDLLTALATPSPPSSPPLWGGGWRWRGKRLRVLRTFGEAREGEALAYLGSAGLLEIAVNRGSAREALGLREGMPVRLL
jgi:hypothetical protein